MNTIAKIKSLLLAVICILLSFNLQAQVVSDTVNVVTAGTLPTLISSSDKYQITNLTVTGYLNGTDMLYIREMAGRDVNGNSTLGKLSVLDLSGANIVAGGYNYYTYRTTLANVIGDCIFYDCTGLTSVVIPNSVTSIGSCAFWGCSGLTSITIPNSVASIGNYAFNGCSGLTSVIIPNSVTSIGNGEFRECTGLTSITIPNTITTIGDEAFSICSGLTSITIPNSITTIGNEAFYSCKRLTSITIPNSVKSIGDYIFKNCTELKSVSIGNKVDSISEYAFSGCTRLASITIPNSVVFIGYRAFDSCKSLTSITIPNNVTFIDGFNGCIGLTSITLPNSVTSIGDEAFTSCIGLTSITIPNSVTQIGISAFNGCSGLASITIPKSVVSIGKNAFTNCLKLKDIIVDNDNPSFISFDGILFNKDITMLIAYPIAKSITSYIIPNSVTSIGESAFYRCSNLISMTIPKNVISVGDVSFKSCDGLEEIHCKAPIPPSAIASTFSNVNKTICKLYIPKGTYDAYWLSSGWGDFTNIIEEASNDQAIYNIILSCNNDGTITVNGSNVTSTTVNKGNSVTIKFIPNDGYTISKVTLNGNDITNTISNNSYTISNITNDITINATFTEIPIYLTFKQADNGSVKRLISKGSTSTYIIEPTEGWRVNSIMFNGLDVTSQLDAKNQYTTPAITANSTLSISFESTNTAIIQTKASNIKVYTEQDVIVVKGAELGDNISVYTESGALLQTTKVTDNTIRIAVPSNKIYLIRTTDKTFKVSL